MNDTTEATKVCTKCGEDKPLSEYGKRKASKDGLQSHCKSCVRAYQKEYREANREEISEYQKEYREAASQHDCVASGCDHLVKACTKCGESKPLSEYSRKAGRDGHRNDCKMCVSTYMKNYLEINRDEINARRKSRYEADPEAFLSSNRAWQSANRDWMRADQKARHAKRWASDPEYRARHAAAYTRYYRLLASAKSEPYTREEIFERDNWTCQLCQEPIDPELKWPDTESASVDHIKPLSKGGDDTPANVQAAHLGCNIGKGNRVELEDLQAA